MDQSPEKLNQTSSAAMPDAEVDKATSLSDTALLREFLDRNDADCPLCQYNLRGLTTDRCPECGRSIELTVRVTDGSFGRWVWCLAASCGLVPLGILFTIIFLKVLLEGGSRRPSGLEALEFMVGILSIAAMPAAGMFLIWKRRYLSAQVGVQKTMQAVMVGAAFVAVMAMVISVTSQ